MNAIWTAKEIARALGKDTVKCDDVTGISIDSRTIQAGELFIALKGGNVDGHKYVEDAFHNGAVAAIVSEVIPSKYENNYIQVDDTFSALCLLAKYRRSHCDTTIIGVTGSVGKTSVKEAIYHVLKGQKATHASTGNFNNHIGLPLSLARMPLDITYAVFELGMNHAGELRQLTSLLKPQIALVTNVEAQHLEFFNSVPHIAEAKSEIFEGLESGGTAILPIDSPYIDILKRPLEAIEHILVTFGEQDTADVRLISYEDKADGQVVNVEYFGKNISYSLAASGKHHAINSLIVLAIVKLLDCDLEYSLDLLSSFGPVKGRGEKHTISIDDKEIHIIDDSYNAGPASMCAAFEMLGGIKKNKGGRSVAVLGDMLELGKDAPKLHAELADNILTHDIDLVFTVGPLMTNLDHALPESKLASHTEAALDILPVLRTSLQSGDNVLIKGSNGSQMWKIVDELMRK